MGKFLPTKLRGDCEEIANPSTADGRCRRNWTDARGSVPDGQVVDASCGNRNCIALRHAYLRPRVEQSGKYRKIADRVHRLKVGQHFDVRGVSRAAPPSCTRRNPPCCDPGRCLPDFAALPRGSADSRARRARLRSGNACVRVRRESRPGGGVGARMPREFRSAWLTMRPAAASRILTSGKSGSTYCR